MFTEVNEKIEDGCPKDSREVSEGEPVGVEAEVEEEGSEGEAVVADVLDEVKRFLRQCLLVGSSPGV